MPGFSQAQLSRTFYPAILKSKLLVSKFSLLKLTNCSVFLRKKNSFSKFKRSIVIQLNTRSLTIEATPSSIWSSSSLQWLVKYHYMYSCNCPVIEQLLNLCVNFSHWQDFKVTKFFSTSRLWIVLSQFTCFLCYVQQFLFETRIPNSFFSLVLTGDPPPPTFTPFELAPRG